MLFWAVVSDSTEEAVELFTTREEAEAIVQAWDRDEPDQAGALRVEQIDFRTGTAKLARRRPSASVPGARTLNDGTVRLVTLYSSQRWPGDT
jgi:hypothetical protein